MESETIYCNICFDYRKIKVIVTINLYSYICMQSTELITSVTLFSHKINKQNFININLLNTLSNHVMSIGSIVYSCPFTTYQVTDSNYKYLKFTYFFLFFSFPLFTSKTAIIFIYIYLYKICSRVIQCASKYFWKFIFYCFTLLKTTPLNLKYTLS